MDRNYSSQRKMLSPAEVETIFGIPRGSLANLRWARKGPRFFKVGARKVMYQLSDVQAWAERNPIQTVDSYREGLERRHADRDS